MNCVPKLNISDCNEYGSKIYLDPYTMFKTVINGCIKCKGKRYTNGTQCTNHNFTSLNNCKEIHPYKNECIECKGDFTLRKNGACEAKI